MRKLLYTMLALLLLSGCAMLKEDISPTSTPTALPSYSSTSAATLFPTFSATPAAVSSPTPSPTPLPSQSPAPAIELIATAKLPGVEAGDWYEWDIAGNYPANPDEYGTLYYAETQDLLIRTDSEAGELISSRLDGSQKTTLDSSVYDTVNCCDGWLYYLKADGVWKSRLNGNSLSRIINRQTDDDYDSLFVYNGRIYIIRYYQEYIETYDLNGKDFQTVDIPEIPDCGAFFSDGFLYYGSNTAEAIEDGPDCGNIWRYNLATGKANKLVSGVYGRPVVHDNMVYYFFNNLERTDGVSTDTVLNDPDSYWDVGYNLYRNYMIYFKDKHYRGGYRGQTLCVLNVDTGKEYLLFLLSGFTGDDIFITQNSIFLYSGYSEDPVYRITFENDQAYLWRLNGLS